MAKQIIHTELAPVPLAGYSQAVKLPIWPKGMKVPIAVVAEA